MKKHKLGVFLACLAIFGAAYVNFATPAPAHAESTVCKCTNTYNDGSVKEEEGADTTLFGDENGCYCGGTNKVINLAVSIMSGATAVAGTIAIVLVGIKFIVAKDDEQKLITARKRLSQVVVGIIALTMIDAIANLLVPGGIANPEALVASSSSRREAVEDPELPLDDDDDTTSPSRKHTYTKANDKEKDKKPSDIKDTGCKDGASKSSSVKYYWQFASSVGNIQWKGGTSQGTSRNWKPNYKIGASGCPMMASLNATNQVTGCNYTPKIFAEHMKKYTNNFKNRKGLFQNNSAWGNYGPQIVRHYLKSYGVKYKQITSNKGSRAKTALKNGHAVIVSGGGYGYTGKVFSACKKKNKTCGHWVLFAKYNGKNDTVKVVNPSKGGKTITVNWDSALVKSKTFFEVW